MVSSCGARMGIPIRAMQVQYVPMEFKGTLEEADYSKTCDIFFKVVFSGIFFSVTSKVIGLQNFYQSI
jgi:hypothetical protein